MRATLLALGGCTCKPELRGSAERQVSNRSFRDMLFVKERPMHRLGGHDSALANEPFAIPILVLWANRQDTLEFTYWLTPPPPLDIPPHPTLAWG